MNNIEVQCGIVNKEFIKLRREKFDIAREMIFK